MHLEDRRPGSIGIIGLLIIVATLAFPAFAAQTTDRDITRQELLNFDRFLDSHPAIAQDLKKSPALVNDSAYLSSHPELKNFLSTHPGVSEEIRENPRVFMNRERQFDRSGRDITRQELQNLDNFLDTHPNIDQDLKKNPKLLNDPSYLAAHPELKQFLDTHPGVSEEIRENPRVFMNRERQFDRSGRDITRQELQNLDNFLDTHPNIEQDLKKNPKLLNDPSYLAAHPELKQFLDTHPGVRAEAAEKPGVLMNRERQFDRSGRDITRQELQNLDNFLDTHPNIEQDLKKNPKLLNDPSYLAAHPELKQFLDTHPGVRAEAAEKPGVLMNRERQFDRSGRDITRQELQNLDNFLDTHPNIEQDLKKNPKLLNDPSYLAAHPELKQFLDTHPGVRAEAAEKPEVLMNRERQFDRSGRDITRQELQNLDNFLDTHPNIEQDLKKNPKLLNDPSYLAAHPELKQFLDTHPGVRAEASEKPGVLMNRERQFDRSGRDITRQELQNLDNFLDTHPN